MRRIANSPRRSLLFFVLLIAAIAATALLQFRWLDRLAETEREMVKRMVDRQAAELSDVLTRDLARMVEYFTPDASTDDWSARLGEWNGRAGIPARVDGIYRVQLLDGGIRTTLLAGRPVDGERAASLLANIADPLAAARRFDSNARAFLPLFDWTATALRVREKRGDDSNWIAVVLNRPSFRDPYLVNLVAAHRLDADFDVVIERGPSRRVVHTSTRRDIRASADAVVELYDPVVSMAFASLLPIPQPPLHSFRTVRGAGEPAWTMYIRHRAGSIGDAVQKTWRRGAAISILTLVLLFTSGVAMILSTRSANAVASERAMFASVMTEELLTDLPTVRSAADAHRLGAMMKDIFDVTSGAITTHPAHTDVASVVPLCVERVRESAGKTRPVVVDISHARLSAWIDRSGLERIVRNLVENAVKYSRRGQPIVVRAVEENDEIVLSVAHEETAGGRGRVRLTVAQELARVHGVRIDVESAGEWTVATLRLHRTDQ